MTYINKADVKLNQFISTKAFSPVSGASEVPLASDSYDVAGRVRGCALASFVEPFARRNAVSSAANGA